MAQHKSAAKRARQSKRKNAVNTARKSTVRTGEKSLLKALKEKDVQSAKTLLSAYVSKIMKAAQKGALPKKTASRKVARLSSQVHKTTK